MPTPTVTPDYVHVMIDLPATLYKELEARSKSLGVELSGLVCDLLLLSSFDRE